MHHVSRLRFAVKDLPGYNHRGDDPIIAEATASHIYAQQRYKMPTAAGPEQLRAKNKFFIFRASFQSGTLLMPVMCVGVRFVQKSSMALRNTSNLLIAGNLTVLGDMTARIPVSHRTKPYFTHVDTAAAEAITAVPDLQRMDTGPERRTRAVG